MGAARAWLRAAYELAAFVRTSAEGGMGAIRHGTAPEGRASALRRVMLPYGLILEPGPNSSPGYFRRIRIESVSNAYLAPLLNRKGGQSAILSAFLSIVN